MRKTLRVVLLLLAVFVAYRCRPAEAVSESPQEKEAQALLQAYLKIDTSNPPGNETAAARFFLEAFKKEGIEAKLVGSDAGRQSVYARLSSGTRAPALLLMNHLDVVPANAQDWSVPPFSGDKANGYIWGRGAIDIKSLGVAQAMAMFDLKRRQVHLRRDVIFLGVADEELGGTKGLELLLAKEPELFRNVGFVINEGGANVTIVDRVDYWGIEVDQKVPLWLKLTAKGEGGHAATPPPDGGAAFKLVSALHEISALPLRMELHPSVEAFFKAVAPTKPGKRGQILRDPAKYVGTPRIAELPEGFQGLLKDTLTITRLEAGSAINSVPPIATADLDIRLLPGTDPSAFLEQVKEKAGKQVSVEVLISGPTAPPSRIDTDLFLTLERNMKKAEPGSRVGPMVTAGTTDSRYFRRRGIVAYGVSPFKINYYDGATVHGADERIRVRFFLQGVELTRQFVEEFCAKKAS